MTLEVAVDRRLVEVHETILIGPAVQLSGEEHHVDVAATDPEAFGSLGRPDSPTVFRSDSALYAIPAALGATATGVAAEHDVLSAGPAIGIVVAVVVLRLLALRDGWWTPQPRH